MTSYGVSRGRQLAGGTTLKIPKSMAFFSHCATNPSKSEN